MLGVLLPTPSLRLVVLGVTVETCPLGQGPRGGLGSLGCIWGGWLLNAGFRTALHVIVTACILTVSCQTNVAAGSIWDYKLKFTFLPPPSSSGGFSGSHEKLTNALTVPLHSPGGVEPPVTAQELRDAKAIFQATSPPLASPRAQHTVVHCEQVVVTLLDTQPVRGG